MANEILPFDQPPPPPSNSLEASLYPCLNVDSIAVLHLFLCAVFPFLSATFYLFFRLVFGTLYPAYASYKAVKTKNVKEYVKWMMYWIVFALFTCLETIADIFISFWLPFYYELKILFVLWLMSPATKGSSILYRKFVHPAFTKKERDIDEYISKAKEQGYSTVLQMGSRSFNYATNMVMQTALRVSHNYGSFINKIQGALADILYQLLHADQSSIDVDAEFALYKQPVNESLTNDNSQSCTHSDTSFQGQLTFVKQLQKSYSMSDISTNDKYEELASSSKIQQIQDTDEEDQTELDYGNFEEHYYQDYNVIKLDKPEIHTNEDACTRRENDGIEEQVLWTEPNAKKPVQQKRPSRIVKSKSIPEKFEEEEEYSTSQDEEEHSKPRKVKHQAKRRNTASLPMSSENTEHQDSMGESSDNAIPSGRKLGRSKSLRITSKKFTTHKESTY